MKNLLEYNLEEKLVYVTPPHAPVLVSTESPQGNFNLAPFEQFMACSNFPPRILIAITKESDTYKNILDGSDFCVGVPTIEMINQVFMCGKQIDRNQSEFDLSNLTADSSKMIKSPRIRECSINIECKLYNIVDVGDHSIIIGDVLCAVIDEEVFSEDKIVRRLNINAPYHVSSGFFFSKGKILKI